MLSENSIKISPSKDYPYSEKQIHTRSCLSRFSMTSPIYYGINVPVTSHVQCAVYISFFELGNVAVYIG